MHMKKNGELSHLLPNPDALAAVSKDIRAVRLYSDSFWFFTGVLEMQVVLYMAVEP